MAAAKSSRYREASAHFLLLSYSFKRHLKSHLTAQLINKLTYSVQPPGDCPRLRFMIHDYVRVINFLLIIIIKIVVLGHIKLK